MSKSKIWMTHGLTVVLTFVLCGGVEVVQAQQSGTIPAAPAETPSASMPAPVAEPSAPERTEPAAQRPPGPATVDPSRGPLTPVPVSEQPLPDAASSTQETAQQPVPEQTEPAPQPKVRPVQPAGAGVAQTGPTSGGAASKPAGNAIAPAKQKQYHSLLIKVGAVAAAGIALGTVYGLSRGTKSTPPGSGK